MRVAMLILEYLPIAGGAQRQLAALAPLLRERGVEVEVITRRAPGLAARDSVEGVPVRRLPAPGPRAAASLAFSAAATAELARMRPHVVHAYSLFSPATIAVLARRRLGAAALVKVLRGGSRGDVERLRAKPFAGARIRALRRAVDGFVTISGEIDAELAALGVPEAKRRRIPNGVDTERFSPAAAAERQALRRRLLGGEEAPTAIYCGRLVAEKRVELLLEAWRSVRRRLPEARLVVVGGGPEAAALEASAGAGVSFAGPVDDVLPWLRAADAFVLPSDTEGLSNALLEAMATGLPVVATRVGAAAEVLRDGEHGRLVAPGRAAELADALADTLRDPCRAEVGARARSRATTAYALPSVADRLCDLYEELARAGSAPRRVPGRVLEGEGRA